LRPGFSCPKARLGDLSEHGGSLKYLLNRGVATLLGEEWHTAPLDEQIETYEYLSGLVDKNKADGWTTR